MNEYPIEELELSVRTYNALRRANIDTVGDLVGKTREEIRSIPQFGKRRIEELDGVLDYHGLEFAEGDGKGRNDRSFMDGYWATDPLARAIEAADDIEEGIVEQRELRPETQEAFEKGWLTRHSLTVYLPTPAGEAWAEERKEGFREHYARTSEPRQKKRLKR